MMQEAPVMLETIGLLEQNCRQHGEGWSCYVSRIRRPSTMRLAINPSSTRRLEQHLRDSPIRQKKEGGKS
jgi:hypothetical protein